MQLGRPLSTFALHCQRITAFRACVIATEIRDDNIHSIGQPATQLHQAV
jgi:hypothetical protein